MVQDVIKFQVAGSLLTGAIIALFVFFGNLVGNVISKRINKTPQESKYILFFLLFAFIFLMGFTIFISLIILLTPTDLHIFGNIIRQIVEYLHKIIS